MTAMALSAASFDGDGIHRFDLRVYYEDTDAAGIVYYANFLKFAERARTEMLRHVGFEQEALRRTTGHVFAVRHCSVDYLAPGRLDDALSVETRLTALGGASLQVAQQIRCGERLLARLALRLACLGPDGRPARMPSPLKAALARFHHQSAPSRHASNGMNDSHAR